MTTVADVLTSLDQLAPFAKAAGWDPVGLQLGDGAAVVDRVAVCHEVTEDVVVAVERDRPDLLVAYHPLLFKPVVGLVAGPTAAGRAYRLVRAGTALSVVHTAFDVAQGGCADALASALGLSDPAGFGPEWAAESVKFVVFVPPEAVEDVAAAMADAGAGVIGNYSSCSFRTAGTGAFVGGPGAHPAVGEAGRLETVDEVRLEMVCSRGLRDRVTAALVRSHPYEEPAFDVYDRVGDAGLIGRAGALDEPLPLAEFAAHCGRVLGSAPRWAGDPAQPIGRVAVVPGSGAEFIGVAGAVADVLVTGDVSHHRAREALDRGLAVIDAGHIPTERPGVAALYAAVADVVPEVIDLTAIDAHPWKEPGQWTS